MTDIGHNSANGEELRAFIERFERLDAHTLVQIPPARAVCWQEFGPNWMRTPPWRLRRWPGTTCW